jgi:enterochelin esterase-like enzyme
VAAGLAAWAGVGIYGAAVYGHNYYNFRGFPPPVTPKGTPAGRLVSESFFSPALRHERSYLIYLPPGYSAAAAAGKRYPVFYFLHGSPGWPSLVFDAARIGVDFDVLLHHHRIRPFLMVMPDGRNGTFASDTEWANTSHGRYDDFVMNVVHAVDRRWSTIRKRQDRLIAGNSEGAYAALNLSLRHIGKFGLAESWSGYVHPEPKAKPFKGEPLSLVAANDPSLYLPRVARQVRTLGLRAFIFTGTKDHSEPQVAAYADELRAAGGKVVFKVFHGGHDWRVWRQHAPQMLIWASHAFGRRP